MPDEFPPFSETPGADPVPEPPPPPACPHCGHPARPEARYCPHCGRPVQEGVAPIARHVPTRRVMREVARSTGATKQTIVFYALWCLLGVAAALAAAHDEQNRIGILVGLEALSSAFTLAWFGILRRDIAALYRRLACGVAKYLVPILVAWPLAFAIHLFVIWIHRSFSLEDANITDDFLEYGAGWGWIVFSVCVQPAVIEELAFRGIIQTTLTGTIRPGEAIIVAAVAFSIMHFSLVMFVPFVLMGLYLGWLRQWSGSLYPPMLAHFLHNFLVTWHERQALFPS